MVLHTGCTCRTNNGRDRSVNDAKVAGIYQDIDVVPGSN